MSRFLPLLLILLAGCAEQARISSDHDVPERDLMREAQRPLAAYAGPAGRPADLVDAAEAMRAKLDRVGYPAATVEAQPGSPPSFVITAGQRAAIVGVVFTGDTGVDAPTLAAAAQAGPWFTSATAGAVRRRVTRALRAAGHLSAQVAKPLESWDATRSQVVLTLDIQAGPRFVLEASRLELDDPETRWPSLVPQLTQLLDPPGITCVPRMANTVAARIRGRLFDLGHRDAVVEARQQDGTKPGTLTLVVLVKPGPPHTLRSLTTDGGRRSAAGFVRQRIAGLVPGQPLSQSAIDTSVTAFMSTGLFRSAEVRTTASEVQADGSVADDVQVRLRELPTQHVDFALGYGTYERLRGGVTYVDEHLLGRGLRLSAGVDASMVGWGTTVAVADPFRFGPGRRLTLDTTYFERQEPSFAHRELSSGLAFDRRFRPAGDEALWQARTSYRFARSEDYNIEAVDPDAEDIEPLYTTSTVSLELRRDSRRPRIIDPDFGTLSRVGVAWSAAPLGATVDYTELSAEWSGAWSPAPWLVAAVRGGATTRMPGVVNVLPIGERLFMGGSDTVRSFLQDDLGPRADNGKPLGGLTNAVGNIELRWRFLADLRQLEFATFYDLGTVDPDPWSLAAPWGAGIGAGIRYRTPVGPIRFDAAVDPSDTFGAKHNYALNLTVGFAF